MENEFISLCDYNIYVSAEKYNLYQNKIRHLNNLLLIKQNGPANELLAKQNNAEYSES